MNTHIKELWLKRYPQIKQLLWFIVLRVGGLLAVSILTYLIKFPNIAAQYPLSVRMRNNGIFCSSKNG